MSAALYIVLGLLVLIFACLVLLTLCLARIAKDPRVTIEDEIRAGKPECWNWPKQQDIGSVKASFRSEHIVKRDAA